MEPPASYVLAPLTSFLVLLLALMQAPPQGLHLGAQCGTLRSAVLQLPLGLLQAGLQVMGTGTLLLHFLPLLLQGAAGVHHLRLGLPQDCISLLDGLWEGGSQPQTRTHTPQQASQQRQAEVLTCSL